MSKNLPPRPNLDHLRQQAKSLLAAVRSGDPDAVATLRTDLPAAAGMSADQVRAANFCLADVQSAIARQAGFDSWPQLTRHVEAIDALQGTWTLTAMTVEGVPMPPQSLARASRLTFDGTRFRLDPSDPPTSGAIDLDIESRPHRRLTLRHSAGPEIGKSNAGIYRMPDPDTLEVCLDLTTTGPAPADFTSTPSSGRVLQTLRRHHAAAQPSGPAPALPHPADFAPTASATLTRLQGDWLPLSIIGDGQAFPPAMVAIGRRTIQQNQLRGYFGPQLIFHALLRVNDSTPAAHVDYYHLNGPTAGATQLGLLDWPDPHTFRVVTAPIGQPRPADFSCPPGSHRTLSHWRHKP